MADTPKTVSSYWDWATELLDVAAESLVGTIGGPIDRAFVSMGTPAADCCPQLTVHGNSLGEDLLAAGNATGGGQSQKVQRVNLVGFEITVFRCAPVPKENGDPPTQAEQEACGRVTLEDVWAIWNGVMRAIREDQLWDGRCVIAYFDQANPIDPAGGCAGWTIPIRANLGGIPRNGT